jgi:hypothetical protein
MTPGEILQLINTGGVIGLLIFFTLAFYNGEIVSKKTLDKIIEAYQRQVEESMEKSIERVLSAIKQRGKW